MSGVRSQGRMLERPNLSDETISACLRERYDLPVAAIEFLPIGNDTNAWVYRVSAEDGKAYFAKVKRGPIYLPSLAVPRYLSDQGLEQVLAPLPARMLELWQPVGDFVLSLYPFIDGRTGMAAGLSDSQWIELGMVLKRIHAPTVAAELAGKVERETFVPKFNSVVAEVQAVLDAGQFEGPVEKELAPFWKRKQTAIQHLVERATDLGRRLQDQPLEFVLCHTDFHTNNVMLDRENRLWIVDWDSPLLAPKERDLKFVVGSQPGQIEDTHVKLFLRGYGATRIDPVAMAYFWHEWALQDIGEYGQRVFLMPGLDDAASKAKALRRFQGLFAPGNTVDGAVAWERALRGD
jgi:spectinomycin phosphotransferase